MKYAACIYKQNFLSVCVSVCDYVPILIVYRLMELIKEKIFKI